MSQTRGEKGIDVALAVDAPQVGLGGKIDIAVLVTGDGDFVPLVRALNKQGVRVLGAYFKFQGKDGHESFINDRLLSVVNYAVDINALQNDKEYKKAFKSLFREEWGLRGFVTRSQRHAADGSALERHSHRRRRLDTKWQFATPSCRIRFSRAAVQEPESGHC